MERGHSWENFKSKCKRRSSFRAIAAFLTRSIEILTGSLPRSITYYLVRHGISVRIHRRAYVSVLLFNFFIHLVYGIPRGVRSKLSQCSLLLRYYDVISSDWPKVWEAVASRFDHRRSFNGNFVAEILWQKEKANFASGMSFHEAHVQSLRVRIQKR